MEAMGTYAQAGRGGMEKSVSLAYPLVRYTLSMRGAFEIAAVIVAL